MNHKDEIKLKNSPDEWAAWEYQHDAAYWRDREQNGQGLIKDIAKFVLSHSQRLKA